MIRPATDQERLALLDGSEGFVAEKDGQIVGHVAWMPLFLRKDQPADFYTHHLEVFDKSDPTIAVRLWQAVSRKSAELGYESVLGMWDADTDITRLLTSKRVRVESYFVRITHRGTNN